MRQNAILLRTLVVTGAVAFVAAPAGPAVPPPRVAFVVNLTGPEADFDLDDGVCFACLDMVAGACVRGGCTFTAAAQQANDLGEPVDVAFGLPDGSVITGQSGGFLVPVNLDGRLGTSGRIVLPGLGIYGTGSVVRFVEINGPDGITIAANGVTVQGSVVHHATREGILISSGSDILIGGEGTLGAYSLGNVITQTGTGIRSTGHRVRVVGNTVTDNSNRGVVLGGDENLVQGNVISGNAVGGLIVQSGTGTRVIGNTVGTDAAGTTAYPNAGAGIRLFQATDVLIEGNLVSGNAEYGILLQAEQTTGCQIRSNFVGVDRSGTQAIGNGLAGISFTVGARGNEVGGEPAYRNVISGNGTGVEFMQATTTGNRILDNYVGTDLTGSYAIPNMQYGVFSHLAVDNVVGEPGHGNLISGNGTVPGNEGILVHTGSARIEANRIGTDAAGRAALPNAGVGINVYDDGPVSGRMSTLVGNLVSGNGRSGIQVAGTGAAATVLDNLVGTDETGTTAIPNSTGVYVWKAAATTISGNLVSGNLKAGLQYATISAVGVHSASQNRIGVDAEGEPTLGNGSTGVLIIDASGIKIVSNTIGGNAGDGIRVVSGDRNRLTRNALFGNAELGIDLDEDGVVNTDDDVTRNDALDGDTGANGLQNRPALQYASSDGQSMNGILDSAPNTTYEVELFVNELPAPGERVEARTYLATVTVTTDDDGSATFSADSGHPGTVLSAIAIDPEGNTSEIGSVVSVVVNSTGDAKDASIDGSCDTGAFVTRDGRTEPECTLRAALAEANGTPGPEVISFEVPETDPGFDPATNDWTLRPSAGPLPAVTDPVVVNGLGPYQAASTVDRPPPIVIEGGGMASHGLEIKSAGVDLRYLAIEGFGGDGVRSMEQISVQQLVAVDNTGAGIDAPSVEGGQVVASRNGSHGVRAEGTIRVDRVRAEGNGGWGLLSERGAVVVNPAGADFVENASRVSENALGGISGTGARLSVITVSGNGSAAVGPDQGHGLIVREQAGRADDPDYWSVWAASSTFSDNAGRGIWVRGADEPQIGYRSLTLAGTSPGDGVSSNGNGSDGIRGVGPITASRVTADDNTGWGIVSEHAYVEINAPGADDVTAASWIRNNRKGGIAATGADLATFAITGNGADAVNDTEGHGLWVRPQEGGPADEGYWNVRLDEGSANDNGGRGIWVQGVRVPSIGYRSLYLGGGFSAEGLVGADRNASDGIRADGPVEASRVRSEDNGGWGIVSEHAHVEINGSGAEGISATSSIAGNAKGGISATGADIGTFVIADNGTDASSDEEGHGLWVREQETDSDQGSPWDVQLSGGSVTGNVGRGVWVQGADRTDIGIRRTYLMPTMSGTLGLLVSRNGSDGVRASGDVYGYDGTWVTFNAGDGVRSESGIVAIEIGASVDRQRRGKFEDNAGDGIGAAAVRLQRSTVCRNGGDGIEARAGVVQLDDVLVCGNAGSGARVTRDDVSLLNGREGDLQDSPSVNRTWFLANLDSGLDYDGETEFVMDGGGFEGNSPLGLLNRSPALITAGNLWWGDPSGPSGTGPGTGDGVRGNVTFDPWLQVEPAAGVPVSILVSPPMAEMRPGETRAFRATGLDDGFTPVAIAPTWGSTGGTIDRSGQYTAGAVPGEYAVTAEFDGITGTAIVTIIEATGLKSGEAPSAYALHAPWPNPARREFSLAVEMPESGTLGVEIVAADGRRVTRMAEGMLPAGVHSIRVPTGTWPSGVYFVLVSWAGGSAVRKVVLMR